MATTPGVPTSIAFTMKYSYDWLGRMLRHDVPELDQSNYQVLAGEGELVSYAYDRGGNLDRITGFQQTANPVQTSHPRNFTYLNHIGYDRFEKQIQLVSGNGISNSYIYNDDSRRLSDIQADSKGTLEVQQNKPPTPFHRLQYTYDKNGNITHLVNNVSVRPHLNAGVFVGPMDVTYTYDKLNQLRSMTGKYRPHVAYGYQYSDTYTYDELGNIKTKAQSQDRLVWDNQTVNVNDTNPVVTQLTGSRFDHNVVGLTYGLEYRYESGKPHAASPIVETLPNLSPFTRAVTYDANGNNTGNTFRGDNRVQIWDDENRLKEVDRNGGMLAKYRYDDQGERKKRQTAAGDAWYVNQYFALLPNNMPTKHIFAGETRIATKTDAINMQTPLLNFYHSDHLGTTGYTTTTSQNLVQHERYFAYGELWRGGGEQEESDLSPADKRNWLFTGKEWDVDSKLYYFGARYFDPHTDVWQSPDPMLPNYMAGSANGVFEPRTFSLYSYSYNNPVAIKDPDGNCPQCPEEALRSRAGDSPLAAMQYRAYMTGTVAVGAVGALAALGVAALPAVSLFAAQHPNVVTAINQLGQGPGVALPTVQAAKVAGQAGSSVAPRIVPELGRKLDYLFGLATGLKHNRQRSVDMLLQLESIGLSDNPAARTFIADHLAEVLSNPSTVARVQENGRVVRDSLLVGPKGSLKLETIWEGAKLITANIFGKPEDFFRIKR